MAKINNKTAQKTVNPYVVAMLAAIEELNNLPPAPAFDGEAIRQALNASQLPADFVEKAVAESARRHEAAHGDTSAKSANVILSKLAECMGEDGAETVARLAKALASGPRKPRVELTDEQKEEVKSLRAKGMQKSELADKFNVSDATIHNLCAGIIPATVGK